MGLTHPPQRFCVRCNEADYEYPYTSYTGQIDQVTKVDFGEVDYAMAWSGGGNSPPRYKIGVDVGYLCVKCRYELYHKTIKFLTENGYTAKPVDSRS